MRVRTISTCIITICIIFASTASNAKEYCAERWMAKTGEITLKENMEQPFLAKCGLSGNEGTTNAARCTTVCVQFPATETIVSVRVDMQPNLAPGGFWNPTERNDMEIADKYRVCKNYRHWSHDNDRHAILCVITNAN